MLEWSSIAQTPVTSTDLPIYISMYFLFLLIKWSSLHLECAVWFNFLTTTQLQMFLSWRSWSLKNCLTNFPTTLFPMLVHNFKYFFNIIEWLKVMVIASNWQIITRQYHFQSSWSISLLNRVLSRLFWQGII